MNRFVLVLGLGTGLASLVLWLVVFVNLAVFEFVLLYEPVLVVLFVEILVCFLGTVCFVLLALEVL